MSQRPSRPSAITAIMGLAAAVGACSDTAGSGSPSAQPDATVARQLDALLGDSIDVAREAVDSVVASGDSRFVAVFIELMRASDLQILHADGRSAYARALESLTGEHFGRDWPAWVRWYESAELEPPPGFLGWKGRLLARLDPVFGEILREGAPVAIAPEEIVWGGVPFEGIAALDRPPTLAADEASYLEPDEPVFGIAIDGEARAYPQRILDWHEMVNDVIGGVPVSLAYCTLCGSGIAYDGRASDGRTYDFGSSGLLMRSNKLMVDRQTRSLWNHLTGRAVVGELVEADPRLAKLPLVAATWRDWKAAHPDTRVLDIHTGHDRPYELGAAYAGYFASPDLMFPVALEDRRLAPKSRIYALEVAGIPKAYPLDALVEERVANDRIGGVDVVLVAARGTIEVDGNSVRSGPARYRAGGEVRAYRSAGRHFAAGADASTLLDAEGASWRVEEDSLRGPDGQQLPRLAGFLSYWFGWRSFHPRTLLYGQD